MGTRECNHICDESSPGIGEAGRTGEWRTLVPVLDSTKCTAVQAEQAYLFPLLALLPRGSH